MQQDKNELIEQFGIHFEQLYSFSPLAARILATLTIDGCKSGLTFEDLVVRLKASKSSISTNLNLLQKTEKIHYFTILGDRKKYYKAASLSQRLNNYLTLVNSENKLIDKMIAFRKDNITCAEEELNLQNSYAYKDHMLKAAHLLMNSIEKFKELEIKNQTNLIHSPK